MELLDAIEADLRAGEFPIARMRLEPLIEEVSGEAWLRARVLLAWACCHTREPRAQVLAEEVLQACGERSPYRGRALFFLGQAHFNRNSLDEAERWLTWAAAVLREHGEEGFAWRAVCYLGLIRARRHDLEGAERLLQEGVTGLVQAQDLREGAMRSLGWSQVLIWQGRHDEAEEVLRRGERAARAYPELRAEVLRNQAKLAEHRGRKDEVRDRLLEALELLEAVENRPTQRMARVLNDLGDNERVAGRREQARHYLQRSLALGSAHEDGVARLNLAMMALEDGDRAEARALNARNLAHPPSPWVRVYAHGVALAAAEEGSALALHLRELEIATGRGTYADPDLLALLQRAMGEWAGRAPDQAARVGVLAHVQSEALKIDPAPVRAALLELREQGAAIPLGPLGLYRPVQEGGMGQVWRGVVRGTELGVAVKVLHPERASEEAVRATLRRELVAVAALDHPGIVPLIDHGEVSPAVEAMSGGSLRAGTPWLAMRWAERGTLASWCGQRPFPEVREALLQLLDALGAAHARGMVHLDVKPDNVLVASEAPVRLWLADFGVARALSVDSRQPVAGTPSYMAPEQCRRQTRLYGPWTDLYAVGGLAWALVTGAPPFVGQGVELLHRQIAWPVPPLHPRIGVPEGFEQWCRRLLAKAPEERFSSAADAAAALRLLAEASGVQAHPLQAPRAMSSGSDSTWILDDLTQTPAGVERAEAVRVAPVLPRARPRLSFRGPPPPSVAAAACRLLPLRSVPLVGREQTLDLLWEHLHQTRSGARGVVVDATRGAGTVVRWFCELVARAGAASVVAVEDAQGWRRTLLRLLCLEGLRGPDLRSALPRALHLHARTRWNPQIEALLQGGDPVEALLMVVREMGAERPVVLAVPEGAPLTRLVEALEDVRVLLLARGAAADPPRHDRLVSLPLDPLEKEDVTRLLDQLVPLDPQLRDWLAETGDPAAAVWTVRAWLADRRLVEGERGLVLLDAQESLPASATEAIRRLIEPVCTALPGSRVRLELAAVGGERIPLELWRAGCERVGVGWSEGLVEALIHRGLLFEEDGGFRFAARTVRRAILEGVAPEELRRRAQSLRPDEEGTAS